MSAATGVRTGEEEEGERESTCWARTVGRGVVAGVGLGCGEGEKSGPGAEEEEGGWTGERQTERQRRERQGRERRGLFVWGFPLAICL